MYFIIKSVRDSGSLWRACHLQSGQSRLHIPTAHDGQSLVLPGHLLKCSSPCAIKKTPPFKINHVLKTWLRVFIILVSCTAYVKYQLQILKLCFYLTLIIEPSTDVKSLVSILTRMCQDSAFLLTASFPLLVHGTASLCSSQPCQKNTAVKPLKWELSNTSAAPDNRQVSASSSWHARPGC